MNRDTIIELIEKGMTTRQIAAVGGKSQTAMRYWLKKYNLKTQRHKDRRRWSDQLLIEELRKAQTISDILRGLGLAVRPGNYGTVKKRIRLLGLDTSHLNGKRPARGGIRRFSNEEVFVINSTYTRHGIKKRIIEQGLIDYMCAACGLRNVWKKKKLVLVLDHINGDPVDNRIENLRFLCPNCNSQGETFCNKKRSIAQR